MERGDRFNGCPFPVEERYTIFAMMVLDTATSSNRLFRRFKMARKTN